MIYAWLHFFLNDHYRVLNMDVAVLIHNALFLNDHHRVLKMDVAVLIHNALFS